MPWVKTKAPVLNRHTLKAQKLDRKADRAERRGKGEAAGRLRDRADRRAAKGGWL